MISSDPQTSAFLAILAPRRLDGEALSSWFVRVAQANFLSVRECASLTGVRPQGLDRDSFDDLTAFAAALGIPLTELLADRPLGRNWSNGVLGPGPPFCWAVCRRCLQDDQQAGRVGHVRTIWTAPLAAWCTRHHQPLVPHRDGGLDLIGEGQMPAMALAGEGVWTHLQNLAPQELAAINELAQAVPAACGWRDGEQVGKDRITREQFTLGPLGECLDLVDALATRSSFGQGGGVLGVLHRFWRLPYVRERSQRLDQGMLAMMDAADRLVFVRAAARLWVGSRPPAGLSWLEAYLYARGLGPVLGRLGAAAHDPLIVLGFQLTRSDRRKLTERATRWGADLARRWRCVVEAAEACPNLI